MWEFEKPDLAPARVIRSLKLIGFSLIFYCKSLWLERIWLNGFWFKIAWVCTPSDPWNYLFILKLIILFAIFILLFEKELSKTGWANLGSSWLFDFLKFYTCYKGVAESWSFFSFIEGIKFDGLSLFESSINFSNVWSFSSVFLACETLL